MRKLTNFDAQVPPPSQVDEKLISGISFRNRENLAKDSESKQALHHRLASAHRAPRTAHRAHEKWTAHTGFSGQCAPRTKYVRGPNAEIMRARAL